MTTSVDRAGGGALTAIPDAITRAARRNPDRPALAMGGAELSYGEFERRTNSFAHMLMTKGIRRGDRVGIYAHKSLEVLVALFGIMKAGAAYVPINPQAPAAYVRHILEDCELAHLVIGRSTTKTVVALAADVDLKLCIGVESHEKLASCIGWEDVWLYPSTPIDIEISGDDLAYIMFTSGSTGRPKGIMHTHRSGLAYGEVAAATYQFRPSDRMANHPPLNFDLSLLELFSAIVVGATIVVVPEAHVRLPASLSQLLVDEKVTVLNAVPFALSQLLHRGALDERDLSAIRWVLFGGEVFPTKDLRRLMDRLPHARFANVYGPAEVNGVTFLIVPHSEDSEEPISIGGLYPGMRALVVDPDDRQVEPGRPGELLINSPTQMVGYWRQPELSAAATYEEVDKDGTTVRWHRTGDLVVQLPDGQFRLLGRRDRMVKIRGHRVEMDEIETALLSHGAVEQAVVFPVPDGDGSLRIEAVVILRTEVGGPPDAPGPVELAAHVARLLPRYAVPRVVRIADSVPRTSTGKPDRVTLINESLESVKK